MRCRIKSDKINQSFLNFTITTLISSSYNNNIAIIIFSEAYLPHQCGQIYHTSSMFSHNNRHYTSSVSADQKPRIQFHQNSLLFFSTINCLPITIQWYERYSCKWWVLTKYLIFYNIYFNNIALHNIVNTLSHSHKTIDEILIQT